MTHPISLKSPMLLAAAAALALLSGEAQAGAADNSMVFVSPVDLTTADPAAGTFGSDMQFLYTLYDRLIDFNPEDLLPRPMLATEWSWSDDRLTLTLKIRQGVKFHDGTDLDAQAVKTSLEHFITVGRNADLENVTSIDVIDPFTVSLTSKEPNSQLLGLLADRAGMILSPAALEKHGEDFALHPAGTGPFMFKSQETGDNFVVERFPDYWDPESVSLDLIEFRTVKSSTSAVAAVMTGQVDYLYNIDPVNMTAMERNPNVRVAVEPTIGFAIIKVNSGLAPMDKLEVRQAVNMAIDREELARSLYGDLPSKPTVLAVPQGYWPSSQDVQDSVKYDPEGAKALLAKAGYPDGVTLPFCVNATSGMPTPGLKIGDILAEQMKPAGITLAVEGLATTSACTAKFNDAKAMPTLLISWTGRLDPAVTYNQMMASTSFYNIAKTPYGDTDELLAKLNAEFDVEKQKPIYDALNRNYVEYLPFVSLYSFVNVVAYSKGLVGETPNLLGRPYIRSLRWDK